MRVLLDEHVAKCLEDQQPRPSPPTLELVEGAAVDVIRNAVERLGPDLLALGANSRSGLAENFIGSTTREFEPPEDDGPYMIAEAVRAVLEKDSFVDATQVRVGVHNTVVRLDGLVPTGTEREAAERDAWYIFGVDNVINEIEVRP